MTVGSHQEDALFLTTRSFQGSFFPPPLMYSNGLGDWIGGWQCQEEALCPKEAETPGLCWVGVSLSVFTWSSWTSCLYCPRVSYVDGGCAPGQGRFVADLDEPTGGNRRREAPAGLNTGTEAPTHADPGGDTGTTRARWAQVL